MTIPSAHTLYAHWNFTGSGTDSDPYRIPDLTALEMLRDRVNGGESYEGQYFKLTADIDMSAKYGEGEGKASWTPIGLPTATFKGTFDGGNHGITNLYISAKTTYSLGLFGTIDKSSTIKNVTVGGIINADGNANVGGICGYSNGSIENCTNTSVVKGYSAVGGICGWLNAGRVENCRNTGDITGNIKYIGGICGNAADKVIGCYNSGNVTATADNAQRVGGICGQSGNKTSTIVNCYNTGEVSGKTEVGGICGYGYIVHCCYNTGAVCGTSNIDIASYGGAAAHCFYLNSLNGTSTKGTAKTAAEFADGSVTHLLQKGQSEQAVQAWGQSLTGGIIGGTRDAYPVLTTDSSKRVYKVTFHANNAEYAAAYANSNGTVTLPSEPVPDSGYLFYKWSKTSSANGEEFTANTAITQNITVYAVWREQYGEESGEHKIETTYGTAAVLDLSTCVKYVQTSDTTGKFTYSIQSGNDTLGASISGDTLTVPNTVPASESNYTLTIKASERKPQISLMSVNSLGTEDFTFDVTIIVKKAAPTLAEPTVSAVTYGAKLSDIALDTGWEWDNGNIVPTVTNSGYSAAYTVSDDSNYDWSRIDGYNSDTHTVTRTVAVTVNKATLTPTASANDKTYDGTANASSTISLTGVNGERPAANGDFAFANADAGTGKTVNVTNITLTGDWGANYQLSSTSATTTAAITQKSISGAAVELGNSLTYTGRLQTQTVSSVTIDSLTATYTVSNNQRTDAGTYTLTVIGSGNFNGSQTAQFTIAKANNRITGLTCGSIVFGGTPSPSAAATFGTPTFTYSQQESGPYGAWNTANDKGTWYVKATVADADNYNGAEQIVSFQVAAQREEKPNASIDFRSETLTGLTAEGSYSIAPADGTADTFTANENGTIAIQPGWFGKTLSIVKTARNGDYSNSEAQSLPIPARPNRPAAPLKLTKTANSIAITGSESGCEFSADGTSWNDTGAFTGLTAGTEYTVQVRIKATGSSFKSDSMTQAVTTIAGDGSTTVKPGESVEIDTSPKTTVTHDGEKVTITTGGTTTTVTPAGEAEVGAGGVVTIPGGSTVKTGDDGPEIKLPQGGTVGGSGEITIPGGGAAQVGSNPVTTITVPEGGGAIQPKPGGAVDVPGGSTIKTGDDGPEITVGPGNGGSVGSGGGVTVPEGGAVQIGKGPAATIIPPPGGEVKPKEDGTVEVPEGTAVKPGDGGPEIIVGPENGGAVGDDGGVTVESGGNVTVKGDPDTTITFPSPDGGAVKPNPDGSIPLPGGTVVTPAGKDAITVPDGGAYNPDTGAVMENVHTVAFDSQGGSDVGSKTAPHGGTVANPGSPTKSGCTFGGWYKERGCINAWNFDTDTVTGNITLYAKWTQNRGGRSGGGGRYNSPATYPIAAPATFPHGKLTVTPTRAERNATVTITAIPDDGCRLDVLNVASGGEAVPLTDKGSGKYTFTMPAGAVHVGAVFVPIETSETLWINPFADVSEGEWYYDAVQFVSENGLMSGYSNGLFGVNDNLSRAQLAQILFHREGRPVVNYLLQYGDVSTDAWYAEAVRWAASQGIVGGYGNGNFGPNDPITREQLAVMLWRYSGSPAAANKELHFHDTDEISDFALEAMRWAVENGIISGKSNSILDPKGLAIRAQVAQMLKNYIGDPKENS